MKGPNDFRKNLFPTKLHTKLLFVYVQKKRKKKNLCYKNRTCFRSKDTFISREYIKLKRSRLI